MTKAFFENEEQRIWTALRDSIPGTPEYNDLIVSHQSLCLAAINSIDAKERLAYVEEGEAQDAADNVVEFPVKQPFLIEKKTETPAKTAAAEPEPAPAPIVEEAPTAEPETPIALNEVKAAFIEAARSGIKVAEIIADTGYTKLSDVPSELYGALMRALERKKNGVE